MLTTRIAKKVTPDFIETVEALEAEFRQKGPYTDAAFDCTNEVAEFLTSRTDTTPIIYKDQWGRWFWDRQSYVGQEAYVHLSLDPLSKPQPKYQSPLYIYDDEHEIGDMEAYERDNEDW